MQTMAKRLVAKVGEYQKDGQTKGEYQRLGVLIQGNDGGEYMLLDPSINLAGVLIKQNAMAASKGGQLRDTVMISVFSDENQNQQQGGFNQQSQQGFNNQQQPQQQGGFQNQGGFAPQQQVQQQASPNDPPF